MHMDRLQRFTKEASFTAGAKAVSLFFIVGVVLLLAVHATEMAGGHSNASTSVSHSGT